MPRRMPAARLVAVNTGSAVTAFGFIGLTRELRPGAGNISFVFPLP